MSSGTSGAAQAAPGLSDLAEQIRAEIAAAEEGHRSALGHAIRAGELLHEAKARPEIKHGKWLPWLDANFPNNRQTAAGYMRLAANVQRVVHLGSVREALAEVAKIKRENGTPKDESASDASPREGAPRTGGLWQNEDVLTWVRKRMRAGSTAHQIFPESKAELHGWPLPGKHLGQNGAEKAVAIIQDRDRRGDTSRRRQPKESGKRLRQLHAEKRNGRTGDLWHLQKAIAEAVGILERFDLPDLDWSEETEALTVELYDDLERHARWNDAAIDAATAHMDELGRQRKIKTLRERADDHSSTPSERSTAARLAEKLEQRRTAARLSS